MFERGKVYSVPCAVLEEFLVYDSELEVIEDSIATKGGMVKHKIIIPIYPLLHNDKEFGQLEFHYHKDTRWRETIIKHHSIAYNEHRIEDKYKIEYFNLMFITHEEFFRTHPSLVTRNVVNKKKNCLHNGKLRCPHKGYDLSTVTPIDGIITCPLHGLKFCANTKKEIPWYKLETKKMDDLQTDFEYKFFEQTGDNCSELIESLILKVRQESYEDLIEKFKTTGALKPVDKEVAQLIVTKVFNIK